MEGKLNLIQTLCIYILIHMCSNKFLVYFQKILVIMEELEVAVDGVVVAGEVADSQHKLTRFNEMPMQSTTAVVKKV
jgi:hypothetical protein